MKADEHIRAYSEFREAIFTWAIEIQGIENSQRTVGLNASRGITELLSAYLHEKSLISEGAQINHRWFKSKNVLKKLPEFPCKKEIAERMMKLELLSEDISYGARKPAGKVREVVELFLEIERDINEQRGVK